MANRRANGKGSIFQESENKWVARVMIGHDINGKPIRKSFSASTESGVTKKLREYLKAMNSTSNRVCVRATVEEYCEAEFLPLKKKELKPLSYQRLNSTYKTYIKPYLGKIEMCQLNSAMIQSLIDQITPSNSYSTVKKVYDFINACCKMCLQRPPHESVMTYNPCGMVRIDRRKVKIIDRKLKIFTEAEIALLKDELRRDDERTGRPAYPYGSLFTFILNTGLRLGEALALNKDDFDFSQNIVRISKNLIQCQTDYGVYETIIQDSVKTSAGNRVLCMNSAAKEAALDLFDQFPDSPFFVCNKNGVRVSTNNAEALFKKIQKRAGIDSQGRGCHALRHTFATTLFKKGVDIKIVSQILGHGSTRITYDTYVSVLQEQIAQSINVIPEV